MKTIVNPEKAIWPEILHRPLFDVSDLHAKVSNLLNGIRLNGEDALREYTLRFEIGRAHV